MHRSVVETEFRIAESATKETDRSSWTENNLFLLDCWVFFQFLLNFKIILAVVLFTRQRAVPVEYLLKDDPVPSGKQWEGASF